MLKMLFDRLFYRPARHAARLPFVVRAPSCVLLPSMRFQFHLGDAGFAGHVRLGADSMLGCSLVFESDRGEVEIGERTFINANTRIICRERVVIGSDVTIAWDVTIYDHNSHSLDWRHRAADIRQQLADFHAGDTFVRHKDWTTVKSSPIVIGDKAWIGFGCVILKGVTIGEGAVVGAGSVVREDVPPWTVVCGNPAVPIKTLTP